MKFAATVKSRSHLWRQAAPHGDRPLLQGRRLQEIHGGGFLTTVATIDVDGKKIQVLPKDYQLDPVRDFPMHVDFLRVGKDTEVNVEMPVHFINEDKSPGIKRGGVLNIVRHKVEFHCPANAIPEFFTVDLEGADIGNSIHISAVKLPEGVRPVIDDRDFTVATVAGSSAMRPEPTEEVAEPEAAGRPNGEAPEEKEKIRSTCREAVAMLVFAGLGNPGANHA